VIDGPRFAWVGESTCFSVAPSAEVRWNWGDGDGAEGAEACHTWNVVGARTIGVVVTDENGRSAEATHPVTVVFEPSSPRPTRSSTIAVDDPHGRVWVVNPDAASVAVLTTAPLELLAELPVGARPRSVAISDGVVAIASQGIGTLHLIDADSLATVVDVRLSGELWSVIADPRGGAFLAVSRAGTITSVSPAGEVLDTVDINPEARGLAMNASGVLLATRWRSTADGAHVQTVDASDPSALVAGPSVTLPPQEGLDSDTDNSGVLSFIGQLVPTPDGRRAVMVGVKANVITGAFRTGEPLTAQTTARAALAEVLFGGPADAATESFRHSFDDLGFASGAVFSPLGDRLYVCFQGAQTVSVIDGFDFFTVASIDDVGEAPQGLALSADGDLLFVQAFLSRSVRVYDVSTFEREPPLVAEISTVASEPLGPTVLEGKRIFFRSRDPRMSRTRYTSCASCHLDGEGDALVWDFTQRGEGLRNTISLRGRAGQGPFHWTANFDEVQDFEHDIRGGQGGTGFLPDDVFHAMGHDEPLGTPKAGLSPELDALAAYVASLDSFGVSPFRAIDSDEARARGERLFSDPAVGCVTCHAGPEYSDSALVAGEPRLHDVGTITPGSGGRLGGALAGLDTPTLRGLWRTAPYLHDGSASTLDEVIGARNPDDRHGRTSHLSEAERRDLLAFLRSLDDR